MLPAFGLLVFISVEARERDTASRDAVRYADTMSLEVEHSIGSVEDLLQALAQRYAVMTLDAEACNEVLAGTTDSFSAYEDAHFIVADTRGDVLCSGGSPEAGDTPIDIGERSYFQRVLESGAFAVGEYEMDAATGLAQIAFAQPVYVGAELVGVISATLPLDALSGKAGDVPLPDGAVYRLVDRDGTVLATNQDAETWVGRSVAQSGLARSTDGITGVVELAGLDNSRRLYGFTQVGAPNTTGLTLTVGTPISVGYGALERDLRRNLALLALVAVLAMFAVWLGSVFLSRQTRQLIADVQRYARGETGWHAPKERGGVREITELHNAFDTMASVIDLRDAQRREAAQELEESNVQLERRVAGRTRELNERNQHLEYEIEQRKAAEAEMERYGLELSRINTDLEEFTYAVSHDLKAPLRGISGFAAMVLEDESESLSDTARENLGVVTQSAEQMRRLIDDLLALSRIARTENDYAEVSMQEEVRGVESEVTYALQEKGIALEVADDLPAIYTGPVGVRQVLRNLIGNAVKYNDNPRPVIEVGWRQDHAGSYTFFVRDNGKGIDARFHEKVFKIFQRLDPQLETEGTGIGLTICKKAIESLGGIIWVDSEPGEGSTFYFSLPITRPEVGYQEPANLAGGRQSA